MFLINREAIESDIYQHLIDFLFVKVRKVETTYEGAGCRAFIFEDVTHLFLQQKLLTTEMVKYNMSQMHNMFMSQMKLDFK